MKKRIGLATALFAATLGAPWTAAADLADFQARSHKMGASKSIVYRLFVPKNYQAGKKYPLMLTLHGAGERGSDNAAQLLHEFSNKWAADSIQAIEPCFVVAPQCPKDSQWVNTPWAKGSYDMDLVAMSEPMKSVVGILDSLEREFNIDKGRVYVSGLSMGGYGTWYIASKYPERFAAAVPVCGGADPEKAPVIAKLSTWTFHAEDDGVVPVAGTREIVAALKASGSTVKYTEYPKALGINHGSWTPAGKNPELVKWVFAQARVTVSLVPMDARIQGKHTALVNGKMAPDHIDALGKIHPQAKPPKNGFSRPAP